MSNENNWSGSLGIAASLLGFGLWAHLLDRKSAAEKRLPIVDDALTKEETMLVHWRRVLTGTQRAVARPGLFDASRALLLGETAFYEEMLADNERRVVVLQAERETLQHTLNEEAAQRRLAAAGQAAIRGRGQTGTKTPYVYLASSWRNPETETAVAQLRAAGFDTYDFKNPHHPERAGGGFAWSAIDPAWKAWTPAQYREAMRHPIAQEGLRLDREALARATATILLTPCGRSAHLEAGWAKGRGQIVIAVAREGFEVELMWGLFDAVVLSMDEAIAILQTAFPIPEPAKERAPESSPDGPNAAMSDETADLWLKRETASDPEKP